MDINEFLDENFSKEDLDRISVPPKPKMESLVEMIEKAKKVKRENG